MKSLLPHDKHSLFFFVAFILFYTEHFNVFNNVRVAAFCAGSDAMQTAGINTVSLAATCFGFFSLMLLYASKRYSISQKRGLLFCCVGTLCAVSFWSISHYLVDLSFLAYIGLGLFAFEHLCFLPLIVRNLAILGVSRSLVFYALVLITQAVMRPLMIVSPAEVLKVFIGISPFVMWGFLYGAQKYEPLKIGFRFDAKARIPKVLFATLVMAGVLAGLYIELMPGVASQPTTVKTLEIVIVAGIVFGLALSRVDFNRLIYLMSIPLMLYGIGLLVAADEGQWLFGSIVFNFGYDFLYAGLWALYGYLTRYSSFNYYWLPVTAAFGTFLGRVSFLVFVRALKPVPGFENFASPAIVTTLFIAALITILFYGRNNMKSGWGSIAPKSNLFASDGLEHSCDAVAAMSRLTAREKEVLVLLAKGRNSKAISEKLVIADGTAKTHIKNIYRKVGVHTQQDLIDLIEQNRTYMKLN